MENPEALFTLVKRKRTKRQKTSSSPFTSAGAGVTGENLSPTTSGYISDSTTEEDEDIANCLILLAQSRSEKSNHQIGSDSSAAGVYECMSCNRIFPTFQALGGHRASHKKPKAKSPASPVLMNQNRLEIKIVEPMSKIHECLICGSRFSSGQALGGHMRRHRTPASNNLVAVIDNSSSGVVFSESENRGRGILELDLNLPAPEEDHLELEFQFTTNNPPLVFSATALVGCNY